MKTKLKIVKNRPDITDEEIRGYMDFDSLMNKHIAQKKTGLNGKHIAAIVVAITGIAVMTYLLWPEAPLSSSQDAPVQERVTSPDQFADETVEQIAAPEQRKKSSDDSDKPTESKPVQPITEKTDKVVAEAEQPESSYHEAEPTEGYQNLYEYFAHELRYPAEAVKDSTQGIVTVSFLIDKDGKPAQIKIQNSLGAAFDKEAMRLIANMPSWKPATLNGKPVPAKMSMPLTFQIVKAKSEKK